MAISLWGVGKGRGAGGDLLAGVAVDAITGDRGKTFHLCLTILPVRKKRADDGITHGKLSDTGTHRRDHPGTISHRDTRLVRPPDSADHGKIVIVERVGVQTNGDFPRFRRRRFASTDLHLVVTAARLNVNGLAGHKHLLN
ncbi:hypothetical protein D3C79_779630 [compost metagenome]